MRFPVLATLALATTLVAPTLAEAGCAEFEALGAGLTRDYDPFSPSTVESVFNLRVTRVDPQATSVRFILVDDSARAGGPGVGAVGPGQYAVTWTRDASRSVHFWGAEQPGPTNGAVVGFGATGTPSSVNEPFRLRIPAGQTTIAGRHQQDLEIRYACSYGEDVGSADFQTGARVSIDLTVPEMLRTYIGSQGIRRGEIALGVLNPAGGVASGDIALTAQATVPYSVTFHRRRGGLRRTDDDAYVMPYAMTLDGQRLTAGATLGCAPTGAPGGRSQTLGVTLDQATSRLVPEGAYSDTITVTYTPGLDLGGGACGI